jgi:hypothetical protein
MTTCASPPGPFECPTLEQSIDATAQLLPRGRAWPANDRAMLPRFLAWLGSLSGIPSLDDWSDNPGFTQMGFVAALGAVRNYLETQLCALRLEFWCATQTLTNDLWMAEYGLPDDCDPYPDLCVKVAALGGRRCELYQELCAANGWIIECSPVEGCPGSGYWPVQQPAFAPGVFTDAFQPQGDAAPDTLGGALADGCCAGNATAGGPAIPSHIEIIVHLNESPAYQGGAQTPALADLAFADMPITCDPDISPLQCLIERIAPAHIVVSYQLVN